MEDLELLSLRDAVANARKRIEGLEEDLRQQRSYNAARIDRTVEAMTERDRLAALIQKVWGLISDDQYGLTFESFQSYRLSLLKAIERGLEK